MHTLVKLTLRLTTKVTTSPTRVRACRSRPSAWARVRASSTESSAPSRARPSALRTGALAQSRPGLPVAPVFMTLLHDAVGVDDSGHPGPQRLGEELGPRRELGIDGQALAQDEAGGLGRPAQLRDERPRPLGIDVIEGQRRDAAPVVEAGCQQPRV